jgi:hypothetical protein
MAKETLTDMLVKMILSAGCAVFWTQCQVVLIVLPITVPIKHQSLNSALSRKLV